MAEDGEPYSEDDPVSPDDLLYRRVPLDTVNVTTRDDGGSRPSSAAFELAPGEDGVSLYLGSVLDRLGLLPDVLVDDFPGYGVAVVSVETILRASEGALTVRRDPVEETNTPRPYDPAHSLLIGLDSLPRKKNLKVRQKIARAARWLHEPAGP